MINSSHLHTIGFLALIGPIYNVDGSHPPLDVKINGITGAKSSVFIHVFDWLLLTMHWSAIATVSSRGLKMLSIPEQLLKGTSKDEELHTCSHLERYFTAQNLRVNSTSK